MLMVALIISIVIIVYACVVMYGTDNPQFSDRNCIVAAKVSKTMPQIADEQAHDQDQSEGRTEEHNKELQADEWAQTQCQNMDKIHKPVFYNDDLSTPLSDSTEQWLELKKPLDNDKIIEDRKRHNWHLHNSADMSQHREKWVKYLSKDFKNRDRNLKLSSHRSHRVSQSPSV